MINVSLLKEICEEAGAPGFEKRIRDRVIKEVTPLVDDVKVDNLGNVYALKKGKNNPDNLSVMVAAHMDEIGFIVTHIDKEGFIRFHTLGGFDPKTLTAQRVIVHGKKDLVGVMGTKPIHVMSPEERNKNPKTTDYFIDLGLSKEEVEKYVSIGDPITRERSLIKMGNCVNCKSIDNRVSVFILIEALRNLENNDIDVYGVFTVQEEVGIRGANVAAHNINPDFGIGLDTTIAFDTPGAGEHEKVTKLGEGAAIKVMDASTICDYRMVNFMKKVADDKKIKWQPEILTAGGTDTAGIQRMGKKGAISGAISIPTRYLHQVIEMANKDDIEDCINLLKSCLEEINTYDWSH
ncbi:M42 family metallopeptidase [Marinigracilibium pacificum]|uniref:M42 family metallopeptidase n=1 Tax=Marinigracilibium pacificum TaxID=2729599 RepID=A0A848IXX2_9BACT|nr:M42 family metallopeptidase [Marinigracilibium pacificum]NMM49363.1 M42 family metallopeptidase [Marinigracilibium pacificum]